MKLTNDEVFLLALLSRALGGEKGHIPDLPKGVIEIAARQSVLPILYDLVSPPEGSPMAAATMQCVRQSYHLLVASRRYADMLEKGGCEVAVLKGASVAALYPVPEYRKSGDLDLLLMHKGDLERAEAILLQAGAVRVDEQHASHHIAYWLPDGFELELHICLVEDFDNQTANRMVAKIQETMTKKRYLILGVELPVLEDGDQALSLLLHMLHHYLRSGFGIKLLCDWVMFWQSGIERSQRERYQSHIWRLGLSGFSEMVTDVCCRYLGLSRKAAAGLLPEDGEERARLCEQFLRDAFDGEEFGGTSDDRMVVLRGTGIWDYAREFHHQMHLNYPRAGRIPFLWPGLWVFTLTRFMHNNRKYRHTSFFRVIREARKRSQLSPTLRLFKKTDSK